MFSSSTTQLSKMFSMVSILEFIETDGLYKLCPFLFFWSIQCQIVTQ